MARRKTDCAEDSLRGKWRIQPGEADDQLGHRALAIAKEPIVPNMTRNRPPTGAAVVPNRRRTRAKGMWRNNKTGTRNDRPPPDVPRRARTGRAGRLRRARSRGGIGRTGARLAVGLGQAALVQALWVSAGSVGALAANADPAGCYAPPAQCLSVTKNATGAVTFQNRHCAGRVYVRACRQRHDQSWACGAFGVAKSSAHTFDANGAKGPFNYVFAGSANPDADRACATKFAAWKGISTGRVRAPAKIPGPTSCYTPAKQCLTVDRNATHGVRFRNYDCAGRVYVRACQQSSDGSWACDSFGLAKLSTHTFQANGANGPYRYVFTGSANLGTDQACAGRVADWDRTPPPP